MEETTTQKKDLKELFRALKFLIISISAGIIQIASFTLFNEAFEWNYWVSYLLSLLFSIVWNFTINRKITFKAANNVKIAMLLVLAFYAVFTPLSTWLGELAENSGVNEYIVLVVTMILNFVLEFLYTRYFVYRNSCDTAPNKKDKLAKQAEAVETEAEATSTQEVTAETESVEDIKDDGTENAEQSNKEKEEK